MTKIEDICSALIAARLADDGWGYATRRSRTEPTALAVVALAAAGVSGSELRPAVNWLVQRQRADGGWGPGDGVDHSTWVTAQVLMVPGLPAETHRRGVDWLLRETSSNAPFVERVRWFLLGLEPEVGGGTMGWCFFPGTAGWVTPTAISMLALRCGGSRLARDRRIPTRLKDGREFLLERQCADGGWNHGSSRALGVDLPSYPETTGQALVALRGDKSPAVAKGLRCAERHLARAESVEATVWLRLGLLAHGRRVERECPECRGNLDLSLRLVLHAVEGGADVFAWS